MDGLDFATRLSRSRFESECYDVFKTVTELISNYVKGQNRCQASKDELDLVIYSGAVSRIPRFVQILESIFQGIPLTPADTNPDEAVAVGAALQAQLLSSFYSSSIFGKDGSPDLHGNDTIKVHEFLADLPLSSKSIGILLGEGSKVIPLIQENLTVLPLSTTLKVKPSSKKSQNDDSTNDDSDTGGCITLVSWKENEEEK